MSVFKTAFPVIDVPESFQHRPYRSNDDLPVLLERLQDLVDQWTLNFRVPRARPGRLVRPPQLREKKSMNQPEPLRSFPRD